MHPSQRDPQPARTDQIALWLLLMLLLMLPVAVELSQ